MKKKGNIKKAKVVSIFRQQKQQNPSSEKALSLSSQSSLVENQEKKETQEVRGKEVKVISVKIKTLSGLLQMTNNRINLLKGVLDKKSTTFHFKVDGVNLIDKWTVFYDQVNQLLSSHEPGLDMVILPDNLFHQAAYFIYWVGSFFKHNGSQEVHSDDDVYVKWCYDYLFRVVNFVDGEPYDMQGFFYRAFPKK